MTDNVEINLKNAGLVLEGGGFRGVYGSGVLRFLMEKNVFFPYVIAASMGACNSANYISRQAERNHIANTCFVKDHSYLSFPRLHFQRPLFHLKFLFDKAPRSLEPFNFSAFQTAEEKFFIVVTDCNTGEPLYFAKDEFDTNLVKLLRASASLPIFSKPIRFRGRMLLDGGIADPIPILKSLRDGNSRNVLILNRPKGYRKKPMSFSWLLPFVLSDYPRLSKILKHRYLIYNQTMDLIDELEAQEEIFVVRPELPLNIRRTERHRQKLYTVYTAGYADIRQRFDKLQGYLNLKS